MAIPLTSYHGTIFLLLLLANNIFHVIQAFAPSLTPPPPPPITTTTKNRRSTHLMPLQTTYSNSDTDHTNKDNENNNNKSLLSRRSMTKKILSSSAAAILLTQHPNDAQAAVGSLAEFEDTNAIVQGLIVDVADISQQENMIQFLKDGFQFKVLRQRKTGSVTETVSLIFGLFVCLYLFVLKAISKMTFLNDIYLYKFIMITTYSTKSGWVLDQKK